MSTPLTREIMEEALSDLIRQGDQEGSEEALQGDPLSEPLLYGAYKLILHRYQTHPAGLVEAIRVLRNIESRLYILDDR